MIHEGLSDDGVLTLTLERPPANCFDAEQAAALAAAVGRASGDGVRSVLVRAEGPLFSGGADIATLRDLSRARSPAVASSVFLRRLGGAFAALEALDVPTVAAVHGAATGGGLELALACDFRVVAEDAVLALPEVTIGLVPGAGGTQRLTRIAGESVAKRLVVAGDRVSGSEAVALGVAQWAYPAERVEAEALALARRLAALPAAATSAAGRCVRMAVEGEPGGYEAEVDAVRALIDAPETVARVSAFLDGPRPGGSGPTQGPRSHSSR